MAIGRKFDISLGLDVGSAITASDRIIAKQKEIAATALAAGKAQEEAATRAAQRSQAVMTAVYQQVAQAAARMATDVARAGSAAIDAGTARSQATADKFTQTRGSLRELASLQGVPLDDKFIREFARQNVRTGLNAQEAIAFESQFRNTGQQYVGDTPDKNMGTALARSYLEQSATLSISRGLRPDVAGDLAASILGNRDYQQYGAAGPAQALRTQSRVMAILDAGRGEAAGLAEQYNQLSAAQLTPEGVGSFKTEEDIATAISIMSQKNPDRAFTGTSAAIRGLRDFGNPMVQAAGITPKDDFPTAIRKIAPILRARAAEMGGSIYDAANKNASNPDGFGDDLTAQAIEINIKEGLDKGLYAQRLAVAETPAANDPLGRLAAYRGSKEGIARTRAAEGELVDAEKGLRTQDMTILRREAVNRLRERGEVDTTTSEFQNFLAKGLSAGLLPDRQQAVIDEEVRAIVNSRLPKGVAPVPRFQAFTGIMPTEENKVGAVNEAIAGAEAAGVNVLQTEAERAAARRTAVPPALPSEPPTSGPGRGGLN